MHGQFRQIVGHPIRMTYLSPSENYTGNWNYWKLNGDLHSICEYIQGEAICVKDYDENGVIDKMVECFNNRTIKYFYKSGNLNGIYMMSGKLNVTTIYDEEDNIDLREKYKHLLKPEDIK